MNKRITLQKILSFQLARVQSGVIDVFRPFELKIMVKKTFKKKRETKNRFEETPLIRRDGRTEGQLGISDRSLVTSVPLCATK